MAKTYESRAHDNEALRALRRLNARRRDDFRPTVPEQEDLLASIVAQPLTAAGERAPAGGGRTRPLTRRHPRARWGLSAAAAVVLLAALVVGVTFLLGDGRGPAPAYAAEMVRKAAADTAAIARSGQVQTVLRGEMQAAGGVEAITSVRTFSWNGDDLAIRVGGGQNDAGELRYVAGKFYERGYFSPPKESDGDWTHYTVFDDGGGADAGGGAAAEPFVPATWLEQYRSDLVGTGLVELVTSVSGLTQETSSEGGTTYSGTMQVGELVTHGLSLAGVAFAGQPLKKLGLLDAKAPVAVAVIVNKEGIISHARFAYTLEGNRFTYDVTYTDLGCGSAITAPAAEDTVTKDRPWGAAPDVTQPS